METGIKNTDKTKLRNQAEKIIGTASTFDAEDIGKMSHESVANIIHELQVHQIELKMQNDELRHMHEDLEYTRDKYSHLYDFAPIGYVTLTEKGIIDESNLMMASLLGVVRTDLIGKPFTRFIHIEDQDIFYKHRLQLKERQTAQSCELRLVKKDAQQMHARLETIIITDEKSQDQIRVTVSDISEHKNSEVELIAKEKKYQALINLAQEGIWKIDKDNNTDFVNSSMAKMLGFTIEEMIGKSLFFFMDKDGIEIANANLKKRQQGIVEQHDFEFFKKDGQKIYTTMATTPVLDAEGNYNGALAGVIDITERRRSEEDLRISEEFNKSIIKNSSDCIKTLDIKGRLEFINLVGQRLLEIEDIGLYLNQPWTDFWKGKDHQAALEAVKKAKEGHTGRFQGYCPTEKGTKKWWDVTITPIWGEDGEVKRLLAVSRDVSSQKIIESMLHQAQKMEAIGTLAGGIAHDFNNILTAILAHSQLAAENVENGSELYEDLQGIYSAGIRAKDLVQQILRISRKSDDLIQSIQPGLIAEEVVKLIRSTIPATIEIRHNVMCKSTIMGNEAQIHQILMNLCTNAVFAMNENAGFLQIDLKDVVLSQGDLITKQTLLNPGDYIELTISDSGPGMAPEIIKDIFDPYFTTKNEGEGTGLGLFVVRGIVETYGGKIIVDSTLNRGTTFTIYLPSFQKGKQKFSYKPEKIPTGNERILFVDDEDAIIKLYSRILHNLGYKVTSRTNSLEALELFRVKPDAFDLVITDMAMPIMSGEQLAIKLLDIRADIPIILCSGFSRKISEKTIDKIGFKEIINKPLLKADFAKTIRKVLDEKK